MAIPWIPLLAAGAQLLGGALGTSSQQQESQSGSSIIDGTSSQSSLGSTTTNQTQNSTQTQTSNDVATGTTSEEVSRLDEATRGQLTAAVQNLLKTAGSSTDAVKAQIESIGTPGSKFDPDAYVAGMMKSATANASSDFGSGVNGIRSRIGANSGTNSAAALLEKRLQDSTTANLAGIESQARGQAAQLQQQDITSRAGALTTLASSQQNELSALLTQLLNAGQVSKGASKTENVGTTAGTTQSTGTESSTSQQDTKNITSQTTNSSSSGSANGREQDWSKVLSSAAGAITAKF